MPKISAPSPNKPLTDNEMQAYVKAVLEPVANDFIKNHKGKEFTEDDVENLCNNLASELEKDLRSKFKGFEVDYDIIEKITQEINKKDSELSRGDRFIKGFGQLCKKAGLEKWGDACFRHVNGKNLTKSLNAIAEKVSSVREAASFNNSESWQKADKGIIEEARKGGKNLKAIQDKLQKIDHERAKLKQDSMRVAQPAEKGTLNERQKNVRKSLQEKLKSSRSR